MKKFLYFVLVAQSLYAPIDPFVDDILNNDDMSPPHRSSKIDPKENARLTAGFFKSKKPLVKVQDQQKSNNNEHQLAFNHEVINDKNATSPEETSSLGSRLSSERSLGFHSTEGSLSSASSIGDNLDDVDKKTESNLDSKTPIQETMLKSFDQNLMNFDSDEQAVEAIKKFLDDGGDVNLKNQSGKTLLAMLLENTSAESIDLHIRVTKLLLERGAIVNSEDIQKSLQSYRTYAFNHNLDLPTTFFGRLIVRLTKTDAEKEIIRQHRIVASKFAEIVFILDKAAPKNVVSLEQMKKIVSMEKTYKSMWQVAMSWWRRQFKKLFS